MSTQEKFSAHPLQWTVIAVVLGVLVAVAVIGKAKDVGVVIAVLILVRLMAWAVSRKK